MPDDPSNYGQIEADKVAGGGRNPFRGGTPTPSAPDPLQTAIDQFKTLLAQYNPRFLDVANELKGIAGGIDPRFDQLRQAQVAQSSEQFQRMGLGGGSAEANATNRLNASLTGVQLERENQARMGSLDALRAFMENETLPIQFLLNQKSVNNAGQLPEDDPFLKLGPVSIG